MEGKKSSLSSLFPPTFAFLIFYFVKVFFPFLFVRLASRYLKPVTFQQIRFSSLSMPGNIFPLFPIIEDDRKTTRFMVPLFVDGAFIDK